MLEYRLNWPGSREQCISNHDQFQNYLGFEQNMLLIKAYGSDWTGSIPAIGDVEKAKSLGLADDESIH